MLGMILTSRAGGRPRMGGAITARRRVIRSLLCGAFSGSPRGTRRPCRDRP